MKSAVALAATFALSTVVATQSPAPQSEAERPRFETASVKPNRSPSAGMNNSFSPGRFAYVNTPLASLIYLAYAFQSERVLDMPDWARAEKFDVTATHSPQYDSFSPQQRAMLQRLLEERLALRLRHETREMPVYELVRVRPDGQFGPRLRASTVDCSTPTTGRSAESGVRITATLI